jgi:Kef-type K+ transport system membrane component KefB
MDRTTMVLRTRDLARGLEPDEKAPTSSFAAIAAAAGVVPLLVLCCAGPVVVASLLAGLVGWLTAHSLAMGAAAAVAAAAIVLGTVWHRRRVANDDQPCGSGEKK